MWGPEVLWEKSASLGALCSLFRTRLGGSDMVERRLRTTAPHACNGRRGRRTSRAGSSHKSAAGRSAILDS